MAKIALCLLLVTLTSCAPLVGGIVGAAVTPLVQPQIDRALAAIKQDWVDPGGVSAVNTYDHPTPDQAH
jgi:hypothetical protein